MTLHTNTEGYTLLDLLALPFLLLVLVFLFLSLPFAYLASHVGGKGTNELLKKLY